MEGRNYQTSSNFRFGFNGQEIDDEVKGSDNSVNYLARIYDPRLGRFLSVDPLTKKFPMLTPYQFASNTPIWGIDMDGEEVRVYTESSNILRLSVGHTMFSVGDGDEMVLYSYGRYAGIDSDKGPLNSVSPTGEGVMLRFTGKEAQTYVDKYLAEGAKAFEITDINKEGEQKVKSKMDKTFYASYKLPQVKKFAHDLRARIVDKYDLGNNNCTTKTCEGVSEGGTSLDFKFPVPAYDKDGNVVKAPINTPGTMETYLEGKTKAKDGEPAKVKDVTPDLKK